MAVVLRVKDIRMPDIEFELTPKQKQEIEQMSPVISEKLTNYLQGHGKELVKTEEGKWLTALTLLAEFFIWEHMQLFTIMLPAVLLMYLLLFRPSFFKLVYIAGLIFVASAMYLFHKKNIYVMRGFIDGFLIGKRNRGKKKQKKPQGI